MRIQHEQLVIESKIPISHILTLEMDHKLNDHGVLTMKVMIQPDMQHIFLKGHYLGQNMQFFAHLNHQEKLIFNGKINQVTYEQQQGVITACIGAISYSIELDKEKKLRSFQQIGMSFKGLLELITKKTSTSFEWRVGKDRSLEKPFVQCETNFEFIKRLASYFERPIHVNLLTGRADFYFGVRSGVSRELDEATVLKQGISEDYYEKGGYQNKIPREFYYSLQVKNREPWQIGDFTRGYRNRQITVIRTQASFEKGELTFMHTLGAEGYLYQRRMTANQLVGLNLEGVIRETEKESVRIQLDIDQEDQAHYDWPWLPEVGNFAYVMPEVGSRTVLTFPTNLEEDAYGSRLLRADSNHGIYEPIENKQFVTAADKMMGLFPEQLILAGKNQKVSMTLADEEGIRLNSQGEIRMRASEEMTLRGKKVKVVAPNQVLLQTSQSNIDIATNFNFFGPKGVSTLSQLPYDPPVRNQKTGAADANQLRFAYGALGALPKSVDGKLTQSPLSHSAVNALPKLTGGQGVVAMNQLMKGAAMKPRVFSSMGSFSLNGGSRVPKEEKRNRK